MPQDEVGVGDGVDQRDAEVQILGRARFRPVLRALDLHLLHKVGQHDHCGDIVVPDHPPEVGDGVGQRTLCSDVLFLAVVALRRGGEGI